MSYIITENFDLYYELKVVDESLPLVFFIHGYNTTMSSLKPLATSKNAKYNSLLIDLPGFGDSKANKKISFSDFEFGIEFLFELISFKRFKEVYVVGHSLGGALATWVVARYPFIKKAILATPLTYFHEYDSAFEKKLKKLLQPQTLSEATQIMGAMLLPPAGKDWEATLRRTSILWFKEVFNWRPYSTHLISSVILSKRFLKTKLREYYRQAAERLTILAAEEDPFTPPEFLEIVAKEQEICFAQVPNSGHALFFNRTELFVDFLNKFFDGLSCQEIQEFFGETKKTN